MTKVQQSIFCVCGWLLLDSCASTLDRSAADRIMRFEGSYTCDRITLEHGQETPAQADVARIRCYQDSWAIRDHALLFTRLFYKSRKCEIPLGRIQFTAPINHQSDGVQFETPQCEWVKTNVSWLSENGGECMLSDLKLNQPYPLRKACHRYTPDVCRARSNQTFIVKGDDAVQTSSNRVPISQVYFQLDANADKAVCKRYASE